MELLRINFYFALTMAKTIIQENIPLHKKALKKSIEFLLFQRFTEQCHKPRRSVQYRLQGLLLEGFVYFGQEFFQQGEIDCVLAGYIGRVSEVVVWVKEGLQI